MKNSWFIVLSSLAHFAYAQDHSLHMHRHAPSGPDTRILVPFTTEMRQANLASMRDHLMVVSEALGEISAGNFIAASKIAESRLGLSSPSAASCKPEEGAEAKEMSTPPPATLDDEMAKVMPKAMQEIGLNMHKAASEFAGVARDSAKTMDTRKAVAALSKVTQHCVACHAAYKTQ